MNKTELIEHIAKSADISKAAAARSLDAVIDAVTTSLKNNDSVTLVIKIKSAKVPKFRAGKLLKDAVN